MLLSLKTIFAFAILLVAASCQKTCSEKSNDGSICLTVYEPVCGCNNKTYSNSCDAKAYGIEEYTEGECP